MCGADAACTFRTSQGLTFPCMNRPKTFYCVMHMVLLMFALGNFKIGAMIPILLDFGSPRGGGGFVHVWAWFVIII